MKAIHVVIACTLLVALAASTPISAQEVRYLGRDPGSGTGRVDSGDGTVYEVREGDDLFGLGTVRQIEDLQLVVDRALPPEEKQWLRDEGAQVYDVLQFSIPRSDIGSAPSESVPELE